VGLARGPYHYWRHDEDNALQVERCWRTTLGDGELPLAVDVELRAGEADPPATARPAITERLRNFLLGIEAKFGYKPLVYTSPRYWHAMTTRPAWAAEYPLWLADWSGAPDYPDGWTWAVLRQYAVGAAGSVPGIVTAIDRDRWQGWTAPAAWWESKAPPYNLAIPNKVIQFYTENGTALVSKNVSWTMRVVDRRGDLLLVFDQVGTTSDWWCKAQDVSPA
jgi:GH25 family lysozyme M1 (1,4-beta-N-acetylmuramidase)